MQKAVSHPPFLYPEPPSWFRRNRRLAWVVAASLFIHLGVASTLQLFSRERDSELARQVKAQEEARTIEFEIAEAPAKAEKPAATTAAPAKAEPEKPKAAAPTRIVELPKTENQTPPDKANFLAQQDMRAEKETIAKKLGEAENRRMAGVANGQAPSDAKPQEKLEEQAKVEQRDGSTGPAERGMGDTLATEGKTMGGESADTSGEGALLKPGAPSIAKGARQGGGGQAGTPEVKGRNAFLPSQQQLSKLIEPAQRNLIQAQHGDITLLNARSSEMAAYIIASAKRIYSFLNINGPLLTVYYEDVQNLSFPISIEADIDRNGKILKVATVISSGSNKIDKLVSDATRSGLTSAEPPPAEGFEERDPMKFRFALYSDHLEAGVP